MLLNAGRVTAKLKSEDGSGLSSTRLGIRHGGLLSVVEKEN
jgi:hypothetical protein